MSVNSSLMDPESFRSNQNGQITPDQLRSLKGKLGSLPGWFTVFILFALLIGTAILGGKVLTRSTPLAILATVVVIILTFAITSFLGNIVASLRMVHLTVEQVRGQVTWYTNRYAALSNGRLLDPIADSAHLEPGDYIFTRLRGTNIVLSAQRIVAAPSPHAGNDAASGAQAVAGGQAVPTDLHSLRALLDKPLDFDPRLDPDQAARHVATLTQALQNLNDNHPADVNPQEIHELQSRLIDQVKKLSHGQSISNLIGIVQEADHLSKPQMDGQGIAQLDSALEQVGIRNARALNANRAGKQTASQRGQLMKEVSSNLFWAVALGVGWLLLSGYAVIHAEWTPLLAATGMYLLILLMLLADARKELLDMLSGSVEIEEGWVSKYTRNSYGGRSNRTYHYYKVNGNSYHVWQRAYDALIEGNYRLYYLPKTLTVVNIEPIAPG